MRHGMRSVHPPLAPQGSRFALRLLALISLLAPLQAVAGDVEVRVVDRRSGDPVVAANVCLGTPAEVDQFGALRTSPSGIARFPGVPSTEVVLTVSKAGYLGYRSMFYPPEGRYVVLGRLSRGGLGPQCRSKALRADSSQTGGLVVQDLRVETAGHSTAKAVLTLSPVVSGRPDEYRISEYPDFHDARWLPFQPKFTFQWKARPGPRTLYFQVRRRYQGKGASIEGESNIYTKVLHLK